MGRSANPVCMDEKKPCAARITPAEAPSCVDGAERSRDQTLETVRLFDVSLAHATDVTDGGAANRREYGMQKALSGGGKGFSVFYPLFCSGGMFTTRIGVTILPTRTR